VFSATVGFRARIACKLKPNNAISVTVPGVPADIPFMILLRALGMKSDKEIAELVSINPEIQGQLEESFEEALGVNAVEDAIIYIGNRVARGQIEEYRQRRAEIFWTEISCPIW